MMSLLLKGIGLIGPGLPDWQSSQAVLRATSAYQAQTLSLPNTQLLPANERRRLPQTAKLALCVGEAALQDGAATENKSSIASVFASSSGDNSIVDKICRALLLPERPVSPTHFHNSVHNAPAGYWSIATQCQQASVSISVADASFAGGLIEAATIALANKIDVLLIAYDHPAPQPIASAHPIIAPFASALLLGVDANKHTTYRLTLQLSDERIPSNLANSGLESLRQGNPAARSLPLLSHIANRLSGPVYLPYLNQRTLSIDVEHSNDNTCV